MEWFDGKIDSGTRKMSVSSFGSSIKLIKVQYSKTLVSLPHRARGKTELPFFLYYKPRWHTEIVLFADNMTSGGCLGAQPVMVTSMYQATIFSRGHTLSRQTNLWRSTFSSRHCSTWFCVALPRWAFLFSQLLKVAPSMWYSPRRFPSSRTMSARNGLAPRS